MTTAIVNNREFDIEFFPAMQGHRISVREYSNDTWETLPNYDYVLCLGVTHFDTLCNLASDLFEEAAIGEYFAQALEIPMRTADDAECVKCGTWQHYAEMVHGTEAMPEIAEALNLSYWDYVCLDCYEALAVKQTN